jgi:lipid A 3-O-deacylase
MSKFISGLALLLVSLGPIQAVAEDDTLSGFQLSWDNDLWAGANQDRWYTNGIRFTWALKERPEGAVTALARDSGRWFLWDGVKPSISYSFGQLMYTPADIGVATPQPNDRPWGAYLFGSVTAYGYEPGTDGNEFRATELKVGLTGRSAAGKPVQSFVHRATSSAPPKGWDLQLKERLGVQLSHSQVYRIRDLPKHEYVGAQVGVGGTVGTLRTLGNVNAALVVGNLAGKNTPLMVGNEGDYVVQDLNAREQFKQPYGFVAVSLTGIVSNYFIDGATPYGRPQIKPKAGYSVVQWGVSLPLRYWLHDSSWPRVVYTQSTRSPEFSSPVLGKKESWQQWGTLTAIWDFND